MRWMKTSVAATYAGENKRIFRDRMKAGEIRSVKRGGRFCTCSEWIDEYFLQLDQEQNHCDSGILEQLGA